ncbi:ATP synthase subunit O, mitochondrial [Bradysia coprophila]|uniref:ATP synthase subunit O, mitochondrial n=1 Tax=Bradysia coprophila TaxID=38358 RepID=UPI00187D90C5|nr:ATP synthase subunit O, mitochondrial [Bradysia coprophila]
MAASTKLSFFVRTLSSAAPAGKPVKPPIQLFGLEGRYATALYSAATKLKQIEKVESELSHLQAEMRKNVNLREAMTSPIINRKVLANSLKDASAKINYSSATSNLLSLLAENGRMKKLDGVIAAFKTIMAAHRGEVVCEVTTAKPLEAGQKKSLEDALKKFIKSNETILLTSKVDPSIIGGMVVSIADKYVDMSIATKVKKYTDLIGATA